MSEFRTPGSAREIESLSDLLKDSLNCDDAKNKPDSTEPHLLSPVSPLRATRPAPPRFGPSSAPTSTATTTTTTTSTSSSSSSSGRFVPDGDHNYGGRYNRYSDHLSVASSVGSRRPGHGRSSSSGSIGFRPGCSSSMSTGGGGGSVSSTPPVNVLPARNIIPSGRIPRSGLTREPPRRDVLGSGKGYYGHGSIMRGGSGNSSSSPGGGGWSESEEWNRKGQEAYDKGNYPEALRLFDWAIGAVPEMPAYRMNRASALGKMGKAAEAVVECEAALRLEPHCFKTNHLMGRNLLRLGQVELARKHLRFPAVNPSEKEMQTLVAVETHIERWTDAYKNGDWLKVKEEADAAMTAGAYHSPQLLACRAECFLKLLQIENAGATLAVMSTEPPNPNCCSEARIFDFLSTSYPLYVRAQVQLAFGRFGDAAVLAQKAAFLEPKNAVLKALVDKVQAVTRARNRGNALVEAKKLVEACAAYDAGIALDPLNSTLHCNRGACSYMLKKWEQCVEDCTIALRTRSRYPKALQRRAFSYLKLEKWALAIQDYENLREQVPGNREYTDGLAQARAAWDKAREVVQEILSLEQFTSLTSTNGVYVVYFFETSEEQECKILSSFMKVLNRRYPSITFLKVDVKKSSEISNAVIAKLCRRSRYTKMVPA